MHERDTLRLVIVGHVDHGKSTLIGRLLYDTESLPVGKMEEIRRTSQELGHEVEFAYVMDHLEEERRQEMTIDTAQAFFRTTKRDYVIIDAPGHRELLKNMITGAAQAQAAVLVVDATEGMKEQTRRHATFLSLLGIRSAVALLNKMDKAGYDEARFRELSAELSHALAAVGVTSFACVPGSALKGENIVRRSEAMPWYVGQTLLQALDDLAPPAAHAHAPLRFPVQDVYSMDGRQMLVGRIESGRIHAGQPILILPSARNAQVRSVEVFGQDRFGAEQGECIGITLESEPAPARGEVLCGLEHCPKPTQRFRANLFWMAQESCRRGERLTIRAATQEIPCRVERIETRMDSSTCDLLETDASCLNETETGRAVLAADSPVVLEPFSELPELGRIILTRGAATVGGGGVVDPHVQ
jgi:sulfate adenylyltransferase large subunit